MSDPRIQLLVGDCRETLKGIPAKSVAACVTSPPYFGLRWYGDFAEQIGLEATPQQYVKKLVRVFRQVRRVLRDDGVLWLNLGDSFAGSGRGGYAGGSSTLQGTDTQDQSRIAKEKQARAHFHQPQVDGGAIGRAWVPPPPGLKNKDLIGIPWAVAFALRDDGWYLRQFAPWVKRSAMPESIKDRPTTAIESMFLLSKSERYFYDHEAVMMECQSGASDLKKMREGKARLGGKSIGHDDVLCKASARTRVGTKRSVGSPEGRSRRNSDWWFESVGMLVNEDGEALGFDVCPNKFSGSHFATFPPALVEPCILAGSRAGDAILDPFGGSGTTAGVALKHGRRAILCELNPAYAAMVDARVRSIAEYEFGLFEGAAS